MQHWAQSLAKEREELAVSCEGSRVVGYDGTVDVQSVVPLGPRNDGAIAATPIGLIHLLGIVHGETLIC
jgi:hypothetical protein